MIHADQIKQVVREHYRESLRTYLGALSRAGFDKVEVLSATAAAPGQVFSVTVRARKPLR